MNKQPSHPPQTPIRWAYLALMAVGFVLFLPGCKKKTPTSPSTEKRPPATNAKAPTNTGKLAPAPPKAGKKNIVLFLGDSLTAGFGVAKQEAYPSLIEQHWRDKGKPWRAQNAGVSGDTSAGVLRRLNWVLTPRTHSVFLCIGANDGLRGLSVDAMKRNLDKIITKIKQRGIKVILAGMIMPNNYGPAYTKSFKATYPALAKKHKLPFMPFLLKDVATVKTRNIADGIHPNPEGHRILANNVLAFFKANKLFQ